MSISEHYAALNYLKDKGSCLENIYKKSRCPLRRDVIGEEIGEIENQITCIEDKLQGLINELVEA